jgi:cytochrome b6-f complex iron-sulfur subunit
MGSSRRDFLQQALYGMLAILGLGFLVPALRSLSPIRGREKETVFFPLISEEDIPRTGVKKAELAYTVSGRAMKARIFLVSSSGGVIAFSAVCSHLGCLVNYHRERHEFVCPCHGGKYDLSGKNISGPPPAPLTRFPVKIQDGTVFIGMRV